MSNLVSLSLNMTVPQLEMFQLRGQVPFPLFTGGYGCGKSEILTTNAVLDVMEWAGCKVACYAPTLDLLSLNLIPRIEERLDVLGIKHKLNKSKYILNIEGNRQIYFRSMDNPGRIVAYEVYRSHVDEADLMVNVEKAEEAWNRIIARNRQKRLLHSGKTSHLHFNMVSAYSTPEGFKFTHKRWKKEPGEGYKYIMASTYTNPFVDMSYIYNILDTYTPEQQKAYLLGNWTNIFSGSVYSYFDRDRHNTTRGLRKGDVLYISQDFNYGGCCGAVYVPLSQESCYKKTYGNDWKKAYESRFLKQWEGDTDTFHFKNSLKKSIRAAKTNEVGLCMIAEHSVQDTEQLVEYVQEKYSKHRVAFFPDATGTKNTTNASSSDIAMLKQAKFQVRANKINPRITDRINSVQRLLYNNKLLVNVNTCPKTVEALEEHAFNPNTGLPEKFAGPATIDDRSDGMGYCPAYLFPIKKINTRVSSLPVG